MNNETIKCVDCGKFISYKDIDNKLALNYYAEFSRESFDGPDIEIDQYFLCKNCNRGEVK